MPSESTSLSRTLNHVSQACLNSQQAYAYAAQHTCNRGLKLLLQTYAHERALTMPVSPHKAWRAAPCW